MNERIVMAGGYNIFGDISNGKTLDVDPEEVMKRNPEIIVKDTYAGSYPEDNISALIAVRNEVMNRSELSNTTAVKNGRVYVVAHKDFFYGPEQLYRGRLSGKMVPSGSAQGLGKPPGIPPGIPDQVPGAGL